VEPAIVEDNPASVEADSNNGVVLANGQVTHDDKPAAVSATYFAIA
jgi:hypothetical protein